jgi:hypothetical protein
VRESSVQQGFVPCPDSGCLGRPHARRPCCGGGGGSGEWFGPSLGSEGAGSFPLAPASFAPTFSDVGGASTEGSGGTSGMDVEATFGERALYLGAGVGIGAGTTYAIGKGVLLVCTATTVCTAVVVAVAVVGGTAYVVHDLFFDGGAEQIVTAFTEFKTKEDALIVGQTLGSVLGVGGVLRPSVARGAGESASLFRAVGDAELKVIQASGGRIPPSLSGLEVKYFSATAEGASSYARQAVRGFGDAPYTLIETQIPRSSLPANVLLQVDQLVPAVILPNSYLPSLGPAQVWIYMPIP